MDGQMGSPRDPSRHNMQRNGLLCQDTPIIGSCSQDPLAGLGNVDRFNPGRSAVSAPPRADCQRQRAVPPGLVRLAGHVPVGD